jgi:uncharacterized paraquat-inducible protein A
MYCPTCGIDSVEGLKYCKRCGANITGALSTSSSTKFPLALTIAFLIIIGGIFLVGLALPMAASHDLMAAGFSTGQLMSLFLADMGVTLVLVVLMIWLFLRLIKVHQQTSGAASVPKAVTSDFAPPQIVAPPQSIGSVTENTTRSFEPRVYDSLKELSDSSQVDSKETR